MTGGFVSLSFNGSDILSVEVGSELLVEAEGLVLLPDELSIGCLKESSFMVTGDEPAEAVDVPPVESKVEEDEAIRSSTTISRV